MSQQPMTSTAEGRADFWAMYAANFERISAANLTLAMSHPEFGPLARRAVDGPEAQRYRDAWKGAIASAATGDWTTYEGLLRERGAFYGRAGISFTSWHQVFRQFQTLLVEPIVTAYGHDTGRLSAALVASQEFADHLTGTLLDAYLASTSEVVLAAESRNRAFLGAAIDPILALDERGVIIAVNPATQAALGYAFADVAGLPFTNLLVHDEDRAILVEAFAIYPDPSAKVVIGTRREVVGKRHDGTVVPLELSIVPTPSADGKQMFSAFLRDISERQRVEHMRKLSVQLEAENAQITEGSRLKSEFLANMSHELRTPLNSIIGFTELLHDGEVEPGSPEHHEFLGDILKSGRHLLQLINDILDLSKVEAGKMAFHPERIDVGALVSEVVTLCRQSAAARGVKVDIAIADTIGEVDLDAGRLKQVLYNYLSNALKFTADQGRVWIRASIEADDKLRIEVEDNGEGIPPSELSRLFVEFQQLDSGSAKRHAGTGLGLALTKRLVEAQGGRVGVHSIQGKGSVFSAILPRQAKRDANRAPWIVESPQRDAPRVLVVEDEPDDQALIVEALRAGGYSVEAVGTGAEAIARARLVRFDAITLDLVLPDASGLLVLAEVRKGGASRDARVVVVSKGVGANTATAFRVDEVLGKPISDDQLLTALGRAGVGPDSAREAPVLVIDDDAGSAKLLQISLTQLGHRVVCGRDGEEGLVRARTELPKAVVLDLMMPGMDGFEFLRRFRAETDNIHVPVMIWTVKDLTTEEHRSLMMSAQRVLAKGGRSETAALIGELTALLPAPRPAARATPRPASKESTGRGP